MLIDVPLSGFPALIECFVRFGRPFFHALSQYYRIGANSSKVWLMTGAHFFIIFSFNNFFFLAFVLER